MRDLSNIKYGIVLLMIGFGAISCSTESTKTFSITLNQSPSEGGAVIITPEGLLHDEGTTITVLAETNDGFTFNGWSGDFESQKNPLIFTLKQDSEINANFLIKNYPLKVIKEGQGQVSEEVITAKSTDYDHGTTVKLTATPDTLWSFIGWTGDITSSENPLEVVITDSINLVANFQINSYPLSVSKVGNGQVIEELIVSKATDYNHGTNVLLTAVPDTGWFFNGWNGDITTTENPIELEVTKPINVTANFEVYTYPLTIIINGEAQVKEEVITAKAKEYDHGSLVRLTVVPDNGWVFDNWTNYDDQSGILELVITSPTTVEVTLFYTGFSIAENRVTVVCDNVEVGATGVARKNGIVYTKRSLPMITVENAATTCTTGIPSMEYLFSDNFYYNEDISSWDVSSVTNMSRMFQTKFEFDQDISFWDVSNVTNMAYMFSKARSFNADISSWDVSNVTTMTHMFSNPSEGNPMRFSQDISSWDVSSVTDMSDMFNGINSFNIDIGSWVVSNVTNMSRMFTDSRHFNQDISSWDVSNVTNMSGMFKGATNFNQEIGNWDVSSVTNTSYIFDQAKSFNHDISSWNVSNITNMAYMFSNAILFNHDISGWDVSNVTNMSFMFNGANSFNIEIDSWDVSNVTNISYMFSGANTFNQDIGNWDVSNVNDMYAMFLATTSFNQDIGSWDVSNVTDMGYMFTNASLFNQDLSGWCVTKITSEPRDFSLRSALITQNLPIWGTCAGE